jgi:hypothetical protein
MAFRAYNSCLTSMQSSKGSLESRGKPYIA